jgi:hypothetical protein
LFNAMARYCNVEGNRLSGARPSEVSWRVVWLMSFGMSP